LRATSRAAYAICSQNRIAEAEALLATGLDQARACHDAESEAFMQNVLASVAYARGDPIAELQHNVEHLELSRQIEHHYFVASGLSNVGLAYLRFGALDLALCHFEDALQLLPTLGAAELMAHVVSCLARLANIQGDFDLAARHARTAIGIL